MEATQTPVERGHGILLGTDPTELVKDLQETVRPPAKRLCAILIFLLSCVRKPSNRQDMALYMHVCLIYRDCWNLHEMQACCL